MSYIGGNSNKDSGTISTDGKGGFANVNNDGVTSSTGGDPVDNLINLAGQLADQDDQR